MGVSGLCYVDCDEQTERERERERETAPVGPFWGVGFGVQGPHLGV